MTAVAGAVGTRERLLAAARELIEEGGYGAAPVMAIARRAGVATGTLYRHFPSKAELFLEVFRDGCAGEERAMMAAADAVGVRTGALARPGAGAVARLEAIARPGAGAVARPGAGAVARLGAILETFARRALQNPRLAWALLAEPVDPLVDAERLAYRQRYADLVARELQAAIDAGEIPPQDVAFTAAALVGGCGEVLVGPLSPVAGSRPGADEVVIAIQAFARRAIGAAAG